MQFVKDLTIETLARGPVWADYAIAFSKKELTAMLTAVGTKKGRVDYRCLWLDLENVEAICTDSVVAVRARDTKLIGPDDGGDWCVGVLADDVLAVTKRLGTNDCVVLFMDMVETEHRVRIVIAGIEGTDLEEGMTIKTKTDKEHREVLSEVHEPTELELEFATLRKLFTHVDNDFPSGDEPSVDSFVWDSKYAKVLAKVAEATGKGAACTVFPPQRPGCAFSTVIKSENLDPDNRWDVIMMPISDG